MVKSQTSSMLLKSNLESLIPEQDQISEERKAQLIELADIITEQIADEETAKVNFICTHNSRRSQLSELWFRTAAEYYELTKVQSFSGGTESTAFNNRMVDALQRFGFVIKQIEQADNPIYQCLSLKGDQNEQKMFSKKYRDASNPQQDFIAVMVCGDADKNCPVVLGATTRYSLPYIDPKRSDNTPKERVTYDAKVREIGREILFMVSYIKEL